MKVRIFIILFLAFIIPSFSLLAQTSSTSTEDETVVEKTGAQFPTESQGDFESNGIDPDRLKLGQFQQLPTISYQKDLHIASQMQNETRPGYYVLDGYVDIQYK